MISEAEEVARFHDKSMIVVSGGALALSIHLGASGLGHWLLVSARVLLVVSLVASLLSIEASRDAYDRERQILDEEACKGMEELTRRTFLRTDENSARKRVDRWNRVSKYGMLSGLGLLTISSIFR